MGSKQIYHTWQLFQRQKTIDVNFALKTATGMPSVRLSFLSPQGPFPWYEHLEPSRNAAHTHLTSMLDPQGGSHRFLCGVTTVSKPWAPGDGCRGTGGMRQWWVGSKVSRWPGPSLAGAQRGPPKPGGILKAGSEQRPKPMARERPPHVWPRERGRAGEGGGGPAGGAGSRAGLRSRVSPPSGKAGTGTEPGERTPGASGPGPVRRPSRNTRKLALDRGRGATLTPRARDPRGSEGSATLRQAPEQRALRVAPNAALTRLPGVGGR